MPQENNYSTANRSTVRYDTLLRCVPAAAAEFVKRRLSYSESEDKLIAGNSDYDLDTRKTAWFNFCARCLGRKSAVKELIGMIDHDLSDLENWQRITIVFTIISHPHCSFQHLGLVADRWPELEAEIKQAWEDAWKRKKALRTRHTHERQSL